LSAPGRQPGFIRSLAGHRPYNALALRGGNEFQKEAAAGLASASRPARPARYAAAGARRGDGAGMEWKASASHTGGGGGIIVERVVYGRLTCGATQTDRRRPVVR